MTKQELKAKIDKLENGIKSKATPSNLIAPLKAQKAKLEKELEEMESAEKKAVKTKKVSKVAEKIKAAKKSVAKKTPAKAPAKEERKKDNIARDGDRKSLPSGKRISKTGKVYYETRANRSDKQTSKKPYLADGGEVKWQDVNFGDSALVISENKMGLVIKPYGRKFHLKFADGSEKTYDAKELQFFQDKMADGGELSKYNISFNYNPSNLSNQDAEKIVSAYTKDWRHNNDLDEVSFYVLRLSKENADMLVKELKMEDVYNIEVDKSDYADGGKLPNGKYKYEKGDEGMFQGDEVRVVKYHNGDRTYEYNIIDEDGKVKTHGVAKAEKFENQFRYFPKMAKGGELKKAQLLIIDPSNPLSTQLKKLTGDFLNSADFKDIGSGNFNILTHKRTNKVFIVYSKHIYDSLPEQEKQDDINYLKNVEKIKLDTRSMAHGGYVIFEGHDHYNDKPLYKVISKDEDNDYEGEFHDNIEDAEKELNELKNKDMNYAKGGITREGNHLMHFEPYFEKDVEVASIDEDTKTIRPSHGYFHPNKIGKKSIAWAKRNGYKFIQDGKEFEDGGYMADGGEIYSLAENMTDSEYENKLSRLNEKQKRTYESLVRLGDSPKLALATTLLNKEVKWDDDTERAYTMADGGEVNKFTYMMLGRLKSDNDYYLGHGNRYEKALWAGNVDDQISEMKKLWNELPQDKKPEWLSMEDILEYEKKMKSDRMADGGQVDKELIDSSAKSIYDRKGMMALRNTFLQVAKADEDAGDKETAEYRRKVVSEYQAKQPKFMANGGQVPAHFGSGKNIEVFGYETKHFDICGTAVKEFEAAVDIMKDSKELEKESLAYCAKYVDNLFGIEKVVVEGGIGGELNFSHAVSDIMSAATYNFRAGMAINLYSFVPQHLMEIALRLAKAEKGGLYALGGMTAGRWYRDKSGEEFKFIGRVDSGANKGRFLFTDGKKSVYKDLEEFEGGKPKETKLFGFFAKGGMVEHGLKIGDKIVSDLFWDNTLVVDNSKTGKAVVNLETGERIEGGKMEKGGYMADGGEVKSLQSDFRNKVKESEDIIDELALHYKQDSESMEALTDALQMLGRSRSKVILYTREEDLKEMPKGGDLNSIKEEYLKNEDENAHGENVVLLAKHFGTKDDLAEAKRILALHEKEGHLSSENGKKRQQLHLKLIDKATKEMAKEGIEFEKGGYMAKGGKLKIGGEDFSFLLELSDNELSQRLDLVREQQKINGQQYLAAFSKKESTQKIEDAGEKLANQERAIIEARLMKYDKRHKMAKGGNVQEEVISKSDIKDFKEYIKEYYAKDGIYEEYFPPKGVSAKEIDSAVKMYTDWAKTKEDKWGGGDSFDREITRDVMLYNRGTKKGLEHQKAVNEIVSSKMADGGMTRKGGQSFEVNSRKFFYHKDDGNVYDSNHRLYAGSYDTLEQAKKSLEKNFEDIKKGTFFKEGGKVKFADKVKAVQESLLKRKKVAPQVQKDYGKTYNKAEAKESAQRIVGSRMAQLKEKMAKKKK